MTHKVECTYILKDNPSNANGLSQIVYSKSSHPTIVFKPCRALISRPKYNSLVIEVTNKYFERPELPKDRGTDTVISSAEEGLQA
jgi:hypothetical protein